jgi:hypothetical protein
VAWFDTGRLNLLTVLFIDFLWASAGGEVSLEANPDSSFSSSIYSYILLFKLTSFALLDSWVFDISIWLLRNELNPVSRLNLPQALSSESSCKNDPVKVECLDNFGSKKADNLPLDLDFYKVLLGIKLLFAGVFEFSFLPVFEKLMEP